MWQWSLHYILGHDDEAEILELTAGKKSRRENNSEQIKKGQEQNQLHSM